RLVRHEEAVAKGPVFHEHTLPPEKCDWNTFQEKCEKSITYVEFKNVCWTNAFHTDKREYEVARVGTKSEPGEGGTGGTPGRPGTGGGGGNLTTTVKIERSLRNIEGGASAAAHRGTRGGAGGTPSQAWWVLFRGEPAGT